MISFCIHILTLLFVLCLINRVLVVLEITEHLSECFVIQTPDDKITDSPVSGIRLLGAAVHTPIASDAGTFDFRP